MEKTEIVDLKCYTCGVLAAAICGIATYYNIISHKIREHPNGRKQIAILDRNGLLLAEYTKREEG